MKMLSLGLLAVISMACRQTSVANNANANIEAPDSTSAAKYFKWAYYDYGELQPANYAKAQKAVLKSYGVEKKGFGCVVTEQLVRDIRAHNDSLFTLLQPKFPGVTEARMNREIQELAAQP